MQDEHEMKDRCEKRRESCVPPRVRLTHPWRSPRYHLVFVSPAEKYLRITPALQAREQLIS